MGEMADMALEAAFEFDPLDLALMYEEDKITFGYRPRRARSLTCKYCGTDNLYWRNIGTFADPRWRLHTAAGKLHNCLVQLPPARSLPNYVQQAATTPHYLRWAQGLRYNLQKVK